MSHKKLLKKLKHYGFDDKVRTWIESFLADRMMRVMVNGAGSSWVEVLSGIPQGSVIGPLLFLLFVNDLPEWIVNSICMFAEDTKIWAAIKKWKMERVCRKISID